MTKKSKQERGITLIALVITIIVLLILAGLSIAMLTGDNGLLNKATGAKTATELANENEKVRLAYNTLLADKLDGHLQEDITIAEMTNALKRQGVDLNKINVQAITWADKIKITFTDTGNEYEVNAKVNAEANTEEIPTDINWDEIELSKPNINVIRNKGIPMLTDKGIIGGNSASVRIEYDDSPYAKNLYSEDNGETWNEYTGEIITNASTISAKSVIKYKQSIQSEIDMATILEETSNVPTAIYDGDDTTGVYLGGGTTEYFILVSDDIIGEPIRVRKFAYNNGNYDDSIQFLDKNRTVLATAETKYLDSDDYYYIPNNTKWIKYASYVTPGVFRQEDTNRLYEIAINYAPIVNGEKSVYPILKQTETDASSDVTISYYKTSVVKLYKKNTDSDWKQYNDNQVINLKYGETLYAKGYDSDNTETRTTQFSISLKGDAIGYNAFDKDDSSNFRVVQGGTIYRYMKISDEMKGNKVRIRYYIFNNINWWSDIKFLKSDKSESLTIPRESQTTVDKSYDIPEDAEWILFQAYGTNGNDEQYRSRIYEIGPGN